MSNELIPLSEIFNDKLFRIPDYQRGYAWKQKQLMDFWDDIINLNPERSHYTGLLSIKKIKDPMEIEKSLGIDKWLIDNGYSLYSIVDGQQRLTTISILLNEIVLFVKEQEENKGKSNTEIFLNTVRLDKIIDKYILQKYPQSEHLTSYIFGYDKDNPSALYLRYKIFMEDNAPTVSETYYTKNLKHAKQFFRNNLQELFTNEKYEGLFKIYQKLTQKLMFNIHEIGDDYDVFVAFETMNNRGKRLSNLELLKNRLIYLTTLYPNSEYDETNKENLRDTINKTWQEIYTELGKNENALLSDDDFLRAHWIAYYTYSRKKGDDYIHFLFDKYSAKNIYEKKSVLINEPEIDELVDDTEDPDDEIEELEINENESTESITVSKLSPDEINDYVLSLQNFAKYWYETFFPRNSNSLTSDEKLWIERLNRVNIGHFRPVVMVINSCRNAPVQERIDAYKAIERFLFVCFRVGFFQASLKSSEYFKDAREIRLGNLKLKDFTKKINDYVDSNVSSAIKGFITHMDVYFKNNMGYYSWKTLKYFFYEYNAELSATNRNGKIISWEDFVKFEKEKTSIEHILPQTPTKYYWKNMFRQFDDTEKKKLTGSLGNLLPLDLSINIKLQNDTFEEKKNPSKGSNRRGYLKGSNAELEVAMKSDWTAKDIYERTINLLHFMERRWKIIFTNDQLEYLTYVDFANDGRVVPDELPREEKK